VVVDFIRKLRENPSQLEILGDGKQKKSYLHIRDLINAFFVVFNGFEKSEFVEVYNVGSADQVEVLRIAEVVREEMGIAKPALIFKRALNDGRGWKGDVKTMHLSIQKLLNRGWKPRYGSEEAIRETCKELLSSA
jgi:UDP-glucose 4-epimerase